MADKSWKGRGKIFCSPSTIFCLPFLPSPSVLQVKNHSLRFVFTNGLLLVPVSGKSVLHRPSFGLVVVLVTVFSRRFLKHPARRSSSSACTSSVIFKPWCKSGGVFLCFWPQCLVHKIHDKLVVLSCSGREMGLLLRSSKHEKSLNEKKKKRRGGPSEHLRSGFLALTNTLEFCVYEIGSQGQ